jgi:hypothetical protein
MSMSLVGFTPLPRHWQVACSLWQTRNHSFAWLTHSLVAADMYAHCFGNNPLDKPKWGHQM